MVLLKDAAFLDARTDVLQAHFVTYNHPRAAFINVHLRLVQAANGVFHGHVRNYAANMPVSHKQERELLLCTHLLIGLTSNALHLSGLSRAFLSVHAAFHSRTESMYVVTTREEHRWQVEISSVLHNQS